jgi:predicted nucleotidyltransferase
LFELNGVVNRIAEALANTKLDHVIVGGFAAIFRGNPRTTTDVDLIVESDPSKIRAFLDELKRLNFDVMEQQVKLALEANEQASIFDKESILRIDMKEATNPDEREAISTGRLETTSTFKIKIATPESILYGKIKYMGKISTVPDAELLDSNDVRDFIAVLKNHPGIDLGWLHEKSKKIGHAKTLARLLDLAKQFV